MLHLTRCVRARAFAVAAGVLATAGGADAGLIVGVDDPYEPLWLIDTDTGLYTPALEGFGGQGIANDPATDTLYFMTNTVTLYSWAYGVGGSPQLIGNTTSAQSSPFLSLTGLGWNPGNSTLYATRTLDSTAGPEGLYSVDTTTAFATLVGAFPGSSADWDIGAFDIDPVTGNAYGFNDRGVPGIYQIDLADGIPTKIADAPFTADAADGEAIDIDGMAVGGGKIWLTEDRAAQTGGRIHVYDLATGQYEDPLYVPWFFSEIFAGATWVSDDMMNAMVPEPASATLLLGGAMLGLRRRRR